MKYFRYSKTSLKWEILYANCHEDRDETDEEIIKGLTSFIYVGKFNTDEHVCVDGDKIKNDSKLYILKDMSGDHYIWQIGSKVCDIEDAIVPHTYYVRKIGFMVFDYEKYEKETTKNESERA